MKAREKRRRRKLRKARQRARWKAAFEHALARDDEASCWPAWLLVREMTQEELFAALGPMSP